MIKKTDTSSRHYYPAFLAIRCIAQPNVVLIILKRTINHYTYFTRKKILNKNSVYFIINIFLTSINIVQIFFFSTNDLIYYYTFIIINFLV